jgi:hypothetical protein
LQHLFAYAARAAVCQAPRELSKTGAGNSAAFISCRMVGMPEKRFSVSIRISNAAATPGFRVSARTLTLRRTIYLSRLSIKQATAPFSLMKTVLLLAIYIGLQFLQNP